MLLTQIERGARARRRVGIKLTIPNYLGLPPFFLNRGLSGAWRGLGREAFSRLTCREEGLVHEGVVAPQRSRRGELPAAAKPQPESILAI